MVDVPDNHPADQPVYCSITCSCIDGAFDVKTGWQFGATTKSGYKLPDKEPLKKEDK
jgi:hypothetical protein